MKSSDLNRDSMCFDWEDPSSLLLLQEMCNGFVDVKIGSVHTKEKSLKVCLPLCVYDYLVLNKLSRHKL